MNKADYESVCSKMRLANGALWPMPITLDVSKEFAEKLKPGSSKVALRDAEGVMLAVINVEDIWEPDREAEAEASLRHQQPSAPGRQLLDEPEQAGLHRRPRRVPAAPAPLRLQDPPPHARPNSANEFAKRGWRRIVAFQTRNPMHRAHHELTLRAAKEDEANLLVHPVVGMTKPGDVDHYTRVRCYQLLVGTTRRTRPCSRSSRSPCEWAARAKPSGTRSSARTTAARTSSSAATTPAPARTRRQAVLRPVRCPGALPEARRRARREDGRLQADGLRRGRRQVLPGRRSARRQEHAWTSPAPSSAIASPTAPRSRTGSPTPKS